MTLATGSLIYDSEQSRFTTVESFVRNAVSSAVAPLLARISTLEVLVAELEQEASTGLLEDQETASEVPA